MSDKELPIEDPLEPEKARHEEPLRAQARQEKDEKDEKESEKEEKGRQDPLSSVIWALILITAGGIWLMQSMGFLAWEIFGGAWNLILIAAGLLFLLEVAVRLVVPAYRRPVGGTLIFAFVLMAIGISNWIGSAVVWPLALIGLGLAIIISGLLRGRF